MQLAGIVWAFDCFPHTHPGKDTTTHNIAETHRDTHIQADGEIHEHRHSTQTYRDRLTESERGGQHDPDGRRY